MKVHMVKIHTPVYLCKKGTRDIFKENINDVRFEVLTAVTVKNVVFWDIKTQEHSSHLTGDTIHLGYGAQPVNAT
jgi:hypothetical protein